MPRSVRATSSPLKRASFSTSKRRSHIERVVKRVAEIESAHEQRGSPELVPAGERYHGEPLESPELGFAELPRRAKSARSLCPRRVATRFRPWR